MRGRAVLINVVCLVAGAAVMFLCMTPGGVAADCPGAPGKPCGNGDVNGDGRIDMADALYIISWLFRDGPSIVEMGCDQWEGELAECQAILGECQGQLAQCAGDLSARIADVIALEGQLAASDADRQALQDELALCRADLEGCESPPSGGSLPATGQRLCYNRAGNVISCSSADWPGQDGFYRAGCPTGGRFVDNGDGTVTDRCTGLMWQKETASGKYTWQNALKYCEDLDLAGHTDWRLPNVRELQSIVDYGRYFPAVDPVFEAVSSWYWSSSTYVSHAVEVWSVDFTHGQVYDVFMTLDHYVRAVRG